MSEEEAEFLISLFARMRGSTIQVCNNGSDKQGNGPFTERDFRHVNSEYYNTEDLDIAGKSELYDF